MGQQQLLLLVLGIVIVGIAVVAGIQAFSEGKAKAEQDAAISDAMRIISDVQAWKLKPTAFGGGADKEDFDGVTLRALGYPTDPYQTTSGCFTLEGDEVATIKVHKTSVGGDPGDPDATPPVDPTAPTCEDLIATVEINGTTSSSIDWEYAN